MTRRDVFDEVGGMSAAFPMNYQDVDYGLKLRAQGYRTVYTPEAELFHFESSSRSPDVADEERALLLARWGTSSPTIPTITQDSSSTSRTSCTRTTPKTVASSRTRPRPDEHHHRTRVVHSTRFFSR